MFWNNGAQSVNCWLWLEFFSVDFGCDQFFTLRVTPPAHPGMHSSWQKSLRAKSWSICHAVARRQRRVFVEDFSPSKDKRMTPLGPNMLLDLCLLSFDCLSFVSFENWARLATSSTQGWLQGGPGTHTGSPQPSKIIGKTRFFTKTVFRYKGANIFKTRLACW